MDHSELAPGNKFSELFLVWNQMILERITVSQDPEGQEIIKRTELMRKINRAYLF